METPSKLMQACRFLPLMLVLANGAFAGTLTPAGAGEFEYEFTGNTVAQFGASGILAPGFWDYSNLPLPFSSVFIGNYLLLSNTGVWTFESRDLNYIAEWILTPTVSQIPGLGITAYNSVIENFYSTGQLVSTNVVPGSATLQVSSIPEPTTFVATILGFMMILLGHATASSRSNPNEDDWPALM